MKKNFEKFSSLLETVSYHPTVISLTETWRKSNQNGSCNNSQKYDFYSNSLTQTKSGGDGLCVRSITTHWQRRNLSMFDEGCLETLFAEILIGKCHVIC